MAEGSKRIHIPFEGNQEAQTKAQQILEKSHCDFLLGAATELQQRGLRGVPTVLASCVNVTLDILDDAPEDLRPVFLEAIVRCLAKNFGAATVVQYAQRESVH